MAYYTMQVVGRTMGSNGLISPWMAAWVPHFIFLVVGSILLYKIEKQR
jgi:lipopolysaccharide export LptBFGC system permease protein LptF